VAPNGGEPQGRVREPLAEPVTIRVTDSLGTALVDVPVAWSALDGGTVEGLDQRTDTLGQARAKWTLGPHAGQQRARVQVGNARSMPPVTIKAAAQAGPAAQLKLVSGDRQAGPVGTALPKPVTLALSDRDGNPVAGVPVRLEAEAGSISDSLGSTDASGTLQIHWTLGRSAGTQRLIAKVEGVEASTAATAEARARAAVNLEFVTPPASGVAGRALPGPVRVSVSDVYGNPVPDQTVLFTPVAGAGTASPTRVATDAHGVAGTRWTLGAKPGDQTLAASVKGTQARGTLKLKAAVRR
jgi:hypothetical protein